MGLIIQCKMQRKTSGLMLWGWGRLEEASSRRTKLNMVMVAAEGNNPTQRHDPWFSPSVFPFSQSAVSWKFTWFSQLPQTQPSSVFWLRFPLICLPPSSFLNFSPNVKLCVICSKNIILQHELFWSHPLREWRVYSISPTLNCCYQPLISQQSSIYGSFYASLKQWHTCKAYWACRKY